MTSLFLTVLNMSLTASYVILFIILVRLPLKKAPKFISYALWSVAAFRLLCPFSFKSILSLVPINASAIPQDIAFSQTPQINSGISALDTYVNSALPAPVAEASVNPLQIYTQLGTYLWLAGIAVLLAYSIISVLILRNRLKSARNLEQNIYEAENLKTPFVLGILRPRIFIPADLSAEESGYIIRHEQTHIRRFDHIVKPLAFLVLSIHWFNPLVWLSFVLAGTDMELSCDERVIKEMGGDIKKAYSASLLSLATDKRILNGSPLAFGEGNVKGRIKNVLNYKKPIFWVVIVSVLAVIAVSIGLMTNWNDKAADLSSETYHFPSFEYDRVSFGTNAESYGTSFDRIAATLTNDEMESGLMCGEGFSLVKQVGEDWYVVPFTKTTAFFTVAISLAVGASKTYILTPDMLVGSLEDGIYRIVTDISYANEPEPRITRTVWAEFKIDSRLSYNTVEPLTFKTKDQDLVEIGKIAFDEYMANLTSEKVSDIERIATYTLNDISVLAGDINEFCVSLNYDFTTDNDSYVNPERGAKGKGTWKDNYLELRVKYAYEDLYSIAGIGTGGGGQGLEPYTSEKLPINPTAAKWSSDQTMGTELGFLDYASDDIVIFHGYYGLFVYDFASRQFIRSLDLLPIDCQASEGDNSCEVTVSANGNTVQLHPITSEDMFVYTVSDNTLMQTAYQPMENQFGGLVSSTEAMDFDKIGNCSIKAVSFDTGEYGYLRASDWTLGSLTYVRGDMVYYLFDSEGKQIKY